MYKNKLAIAIAGKTSPTRGTKIDGRYKLNICYSKSLDLGFLPGSFDKKPKTKSDTKKITTV